MSDERVSNRLQENEAKFKNKYFSNILRPNFRKIAFLLTTSALLAVE